MKKIFVLVTTCCALVLTSCAPRTVLPPKSSEGVHKITFYSPSLKKDMRVDVFLPNGYDAHQKYPVLYLFHGKDGNADTWMNGSQGSGAVGVNSIATELIAQGKIRPLIIVAPEIDNGYGINTSSTTQSVHGYSRGMYEDYVIKDLVPYIDQHYSTIADKSGRYVGGLSMGGFAALHDSFLHPDVFSKVGVMSAALWVGGLPAELQWIYPTSADKAARDPITIAENKSLQGLSVLVVEGGSDPFLAADRHLYRELQHRGVSVVYHEYPGGHNYTFWSEHAAELLLFFDGKSTS